MISTPQRTLTSNERLDERWRAARARLSITFGQSSSRSRKEMSMTSTRTPGIRLGRDGRFFIDKRYRGIRIGTAQRARTATRTGVHGWRHCRR